MVCDTALTRYCRWYVFFTESAQAWPYVSTDPHTPLLDPTGYVMAVDSPFRHGLLVLIGYSIALVIAFWIVMEWILRRIEPLPPEVRPIWDRMFITFSIVFFIVAVVSWLLIAAVIHLVVGGSKTEGSFPDALGIAGWSFAPEIVAFPLSLGLVYLDLRDVGFDGSNPERAIEGMEQLAMETSGMFGGIIFILVTAWSVYIIAGMVSETHEVPRDRAWLAAMLIGVGSVVLHLIA